MVVLHDSHSDVLPTMLRIGYSYYWGKLKYEGYDDHEGH